jgi:hypothetical protein
MYYMTLLMAHKKWFKLEGLKVNVAMRQAKDGFGKVKKSVEAMEGHRRRVMWIGYYLYHNSDVDPDDRIRDMSYECIHTLHYGFNRRKLRLTHQQTGLERLLKITFP